MFQMSTPAFYNLYSNSDEVLNFSIYVKVIKNLIFPVVVLQFGNTYLTELIFRYLRFWLIGFFIFCSIFDVFVQLEI